MNEPEHGREAYAKAPEGPTPRSGERGSPREREPEDLGFELPAPANASRIRVLVVVVAVLAGAFAFGYFQHQRAHDEAITPVPVGSALARVEVISPKPLTSNHALDLPGVIKPLEETKLFPRTTGYVRRWSVDIGDHVKEGQVLAEIDTPDVDAQLAQARAQLLQARASLAQNVAQRKFSSSNITRYETLEAQKLVAAQQVEQTRAQADTDLANVAAAQANVTAQEANVRRLEDLAAFAKVTAPYAGTITQRGVDVGQLVGPTDSTPMFTLDATDPVRVFVDVPQTVAPSVQVGNAATVRVREFAGRTFTGKVMRAAGALDPDLHTMSTEIDVPNTDGALLPGMYVQAELTLPVPHRVLEIPSTALYNDADGLRVAVVGPQNRVHFSKVTIERDTGATLWIATGLTGDERILKIAVPSLVEGDVVEVDAPAASGTAAK